MKRAYYSQLIGTYIGFKKFNLRGNMKKFTVSFKKVVQDGNGDYREVSISGAIEGETTEEILAQYKVVEEQMLEGKMPETSAPKKDITLKDGKGKEVKAENVKPLKENPKEEDKKVEAPKEEEKKVEAPKEEKKKETKSETQVKTNSGKTGKVVNYDRKNDDHKNQFANWLDEEHAGWDEEDKIQSFSNASIKCAGIPFLDAEGEILQSFKDTFIGYVNG